MTPAEDTNDAALASLARLEAITRRLRRDCPWDREQDERSIVPHTVEEAYELADAAASGDDAKLVDELGDVLFQVLFLSLLLEERGAGDLATVAEGMAEKLVRRHPHVFEESEARELLAGADPATAAEVLSNWDRIKREVEGRGGEEPFGDLPETLPALLYARKILRRGDPDGGASRLPEPESRDAAEAWIGELLLAAVGLARRLGVDPELALRAAANKVRDASLSGE